MIPRALLAAVLVWAALLASGCKDKASEEAAQAPTRPMDVMAEVAKAKYDPPADGRLTEKQVEMFLAVKAREREIREASIREIEAKTAAQKEGEADLGQSMKSVGDVVGLTMADLRAALELGHNPKEYTWVEERVAEAQVAEANQILSERVDQNRTQYLAMLEEERKGATTEEQRAEIDRQIEEFKRRPDNAAPASPAVQHNMALLAKHRDELLEAQLGDAAAAAGRSTHEKTSQEGQGH
ncbi:MAG TPA: hypothetical protein VJ725_34940 [Thermoanaerobaculia bacterium]|nr:hypothetical protein [Thermoanaerobaculia bacterium]